MTATPRQALARFLDDERGLETLEWAIIVGLVVSGTIVLMTAIGGWAKSQYTNMQAEMPGS